MRLYISPGELIGNTHDVRELEEIIRLAATRIQVISGHNPRDTNLTTSEQELVKAGRNIHAIKSLRERLGLGLKEAKGIVDTYRFSKGG